MGICSSCLGLNRGRRQEQDSEYAGLLGEDSLRPQYGSLSGGPNQGLAPADLQSIQFEEAALQKILAHTSNTLIDIFALHPQSNQPDSSAAFASAADSKSRQYQQLLEQAISSSSRKSSSSQATDKVAGRTTHSGQQSAVEDHERVLTEMKTIKRGKIGDLVGGFASIQDNRSLIRGSL